MQKPTTTKTPGRQSRSASERIAALKELAHQPDTSPEPFVAALGDKSNLVVAAAAGILQRMRPESAIGPLIDCYWRLAASGVKGDAGCIGRLAVVQCLLDCRAMEAGPVFLHAIRTSQPERTGNGMDDTAIPLRAQAAAALAELKVPGALLALSLLLFDTEPKVPYAPEDRLYVTMSTRIAAARSLAALGDQGGSAILGVRLVHGQGEVSEVLVECMDALTYLDPEATMQLLPPYLTHNDPYLAAGAATALAALPFQWQEQAVMCLAEACAKAVKDARVPLALALASVRCNAAVPALADLAGHPDLGVRLAAVEGLEQRGDNACIAVLQDIVDRQGDVAVVRAARAALGRISR